MGCRIDGQTGMQREGDERVERRGAERCRAEAEAAATKYLSFLLRVSPLVRPSVRPRIERARLLLRGRGKEDNGELSCRINFVGL